MAYSVQLIQFPGSGGGVNINNDYQGFPTTPFRYFLLSMWVCLGPDTNPREFAFDNHNTWGSVTLGQTTGVRLYLISGVLAPTLLDSYFPCTPGITLQHVLVSVDTVAQNAQVYVNDVRLTQSTPWASSGTFNLGSLLYEIWVMTGSGSASPGSGAGDFYAAAPAAFYDLTMAANRRKFINADLTPVDLGTTATGPLGVAPQIWMTARSGVANNFALNAGTGADWTITPPFVFQAPGSCVAPTPPPGTVRLAMDNVVATAQATLLPKNLISLRWSDDRGHSWGSPVTQDIGEAGEYRTSLQWQRLSFARDRIFELSWSVPMRTALQGAWVDVTPAQS